LLPQAHRIASVAALLLLLLSAPAVLGHAEFVSGSPGPGDEIVGSPSALVVEFSQDLDASRSSLVVRDAAGTRIARGGETGDSARQLRLALPELAPGVYEVRWTSFSSEDDELDRGSYTFTVLDAPSPTAAPPTASPEPTTTTATSTPTATPPGPTSGPTPTPTAAPEPTPGASLGEAVIPIAVALLVAAAIAVQLLRRRAA
jgi:methionine-rich copper-binding protein CopC